MTITSENVLELYRALELTDVAIWITGRLALDAAVGHQTRPLTDLDIAV